MSLVKTSGPKQQPKGTFQYSHTGRQAQQASSGTHKPGRGRGQDHNQGSRGGATWYRGAGQLRGRSSFRGRGRSGGGNHQGKRGGNNQYQGQHQDNTKPTPGIGCLPDPTSSNLGQVHLTHRELGYRPSQESGQKHQIF